MERDHGPPVVEGAASLHTTRETIVMRAAQSQAPGAVKTLIHRLRKRYTARLREEVGRTVSDAAEVDEEIHALCEALIASEGQLGP